MRKLLEHTWADQLGYAVIGTPDLLECDQGFFARAVVPTRVELRDALSTTPNDKVDRRAL